MPRRKKLMLEEWREIADAPCYWISNLGRVAKGDNAPEYEITVSETNDQYHEMVVRLHIDGKWRRRHVSKLVYSAFSDDPPQYDDFRTHCIDGNRRNCRIDNLGTALPQSLQRTDEQVTAYEQWCLPSIKRYIKQNEVNSIGNGFDVDDFIGNASLFLWKYLPLYNPRRTFIAWGRKYIRMAFLKELESHNKRRKWETIYEPEEKK